MTRQVYLITHPDVIVDPDVPAPQWPLSALGRARMERMLDKPWVQGIGAVYCSSEQKAVDGAQILASYLGLDFEMIEGLGEVDRSATGYLPADEHQAVADLLFSRPDESVRGWETARDAQKRMAAAVDAILDGPLAEGAVAIVTHGGVGALYLSHLKGVGIERGQEAPHPGGGCYYCFDADSRLLVHGWRTIDGRVWTVG